MVAGYNSEVRTYPYSNDYGISISPNPSNNFFNISYYLDMPENVSVIIINYIGQTMMVAANNELQGIGNHEYQFRPKDPGIYLVKVKVGGYTNFYKVVKN